MGEKEEEHVVEGFDVSAIKILDKQTELTEPNLSKCMIAVGYSVLALVRCIEEGLDDTLHDGMHDIKEAIESTVQR